MHFYWLPPLLAAVLDLFLSMLVLWRAPHRRLNQTFALFALCLTSWNLDIAALYFFTDHELALYWSSVFRYGMLFIPPTIYHLALALTGRWTLISRLFLAVGYGTAFALCLVNSQGTLVSHLKTFAWGYYPVGGPLYKFHTLSDVLYFGATLYHLVRSVVVNESARQRQQLKIVLLGFAVALPVGLTNLLPVYGVSIYPLGNLGNVFLSCALTYAIVKHRLLDIELIITKTTASMAALILWLAPLWILTAAVQQQIYGASDTRLLLFALAVFVLSGLVFPWLLRASEAWVRHMLWGQKYDSLQALSVFQRTIIHVLEQKTIVEDLRAVLTDALQTEFVTIYLLQPATGVYTDPQNGRAAFLPADPFLLTLDRQQEPVVREEAALQEDDPHAIQLATTLAEHNSEVCVPLRTQDRLIGFIFLGKKRNRDIFSSEDLRLLATLGTEIAVALDNARLYAELRASQALLARSDRLAAIGTLAAGIAHEIRNPLVAMQTFVQLLPERLDDPEFRTTFMQIVSNELKRVSTLINDLLTFARPSPVRLGEVQLNALAEQIVRLLTGQAKQKGITLTARLAPMLPPLVVDPEQIKQVFMNLVLNALQATNNDGAVTVATALLRGLDGQSYCEVTVQDTGAGISVEHTEQIFDPFFTTKETGMGLGLFIVHQIIKEHGGSINVEGTVGQGTRFLVRLPLTGVPLSEPVPHEAAQEQAENNDAPPHPSHPPAPSSQ